MSKRSLWKSYLAGYWLGDLTLKAYCLRLAPKTGQLDLV